jgi:hypothetical protein
MKTISHDDVTWLTRSNNGDANEIDGDDDPNRSAALSVGCSAGDGQRFRILRPRLRRLGAVFLALDAEPHREVALKQMRDNHDCDPDSRRRFLLEAEVIDCMEHFGIERVYGLGAYANGRP